MTNKPVILYGAGYWGGEYLLSLAQENIHVEAFCDRNAKNITRHFGCDVYSFDDAKKKYRDYPFIIALKKKNNIEDVSRMLGENGLEYYRGIDEYYQGTVDREAETEICGQGAPYRICKDLLNKNGIAYSFGIGCDYSFEQELCEKYGMTVYAFDPSPEVVIKMKEDHTPNLKYYPYGIADEDGIKQWYLPKSGGSDYSECISYWVESSSVIDVKVFCLKNLMKKFGHEHINLLKMDVEGTEFKVLPDILAENNIDQICIETHARMFPDSVCVMRKTKELFNKNGYELVSNGIQEQTWVKMKGIKGK